MRGVAIIFVCMLLFQTDVFAQLSTSSCALLRTASSLTTIIPEVTQIAMRSYRASSSSQGSTHQRQKRFIKDEITGKSSTSGNIRGTIVEQMIANTIRDVNFTNVAILIFNNNDTMNKLHQNIDMEAVMRMIIREIDYEKLGNGIMATIESELDLEHLVASIINVTQLDVIHEQFLANGTLPQRFLKHLHPDLNTQLVERIFSTLKNVTYRVVKVLSKSERYDNYLFNMITQQALTPLSNIIQGVKADKPKTFDQLVEIIVNNVNRVATEQFTTDAKRKIPKKSGKNPTASSVSAVDLSNSDEVKMMLYQWSIAVDSMGQTARVMLKSLEQLYCGST
ncbi:unnamed protein product [Adineta ricciae]|uniref:Uncharacterized protein n=1 Tax=Adineta ricciae TaxID=249248 RepID=A0A814MTD7_ADIRI|nr:unnamed protein product [Adineta ricciae]CAF1222170.1 unnamed protein product [Adineta ricciae]